MRTAFFVILLLAFLTSQSATAEPDFEDGFESGDLSATGSLGFRWTSSAWAYVVTENSRADGQPRPTGSDWTPISGDHSLLFSYEAGREMSEQRFNTGAEYDDLWISYWIRVPINYMQESGTVDKWLALWMDGYSQFGDGSTVFWTLWNGSNGNVNIGISYSAGDNQTSGPVYQLREFIRVPEDRGRWMRVVYRAKPSSTGGNDGILEMWRQWEGQSTFTKFHEDRSASIKRPDAGIQGFNNGYILGWVNKAYQRNTEWLVDSFKLSSEPFVDGPSATLEVPPRAPVAQ